MKKAVIFFLKYLMKSLFVILSICLVGFGSYKISYEILSKKADEGTLEVKKQELKDIKDQAKTEQVSQNLIFVKNDKDVITHAILEVFSMETGNMDYVTIPVKMDYVIPSVMYQKMCVVDPEIPQIVKFSKLRQYFTKFDDEEGYGYAELIVEKMLGIDISYFTVISESLYESHYEEKNMTTPFVQTVQQESSDDTEQTTKATKVKTSVDMDVSVLSESYLNQLKDIGTDESDLMDYIKEQYKETDDMYSNLTVYNKLGYVEAYNQKLNLDNIHYWGIPGSFEGKNFTMDFTAAKKFIDKLVNNTESYTEPQSQDSTLDTKKIVKNPISSVGKNILVLNGSKIAGLAAKKQTELVNAGFTVPKVGDYTQEVLTRTKIIVPKKRMGNDLVQYFKNPKIVVGDVQEGYDIEIILGTVDAN